jgi:hypothetical protein
MRRAIFTALLCLLVIPASADAMIQIDQGIAGVRLDNTRAQVKAALGTPARVINGSNDFGKFTEYRYRGGIRVTFQGRTRVTGVSTSGLGDRTARGVGVRSREAAVRNKVAGITCESTGGRVCHTGQFNAGERVTAFIIRNGRVTRVDVGFVID